MKKFTSRRWKAISIRGYGAVSKRRCATSSHILESKRGGIRVPIGSATSSVTLSAGYRALLGNRDCIASRSRKSNLITALSNQSLQPTKEITNSKVGGRKDDDIYSHSIA